jgi:protein-tyrosine phosphatase
MSDFERAQRVISRLYIGPLQSARDYEWQKRKGITHVLTVTDAMPWKTKRPSHLTDHMIVPISDTGPLGRHLDRMLRFMYEGRSQGKVLVHCTMGINRSASAVISFLMHKRGLSYKSALETVRHARPWVSPTREMRGEVRRYFEERKRRNRRK